MQEYAKRKILQDEMVVLVPVSKLGLLPVERKLFREIMSWLDMEFCWCFQWSVASLVVKILRGDTCEQSLEKFEQNIQDLQIDEFDDAPNANPCFSSAIRTIRLRTKAITDLENTCTCIEIK